MDDLYAEFMDEGNLVRRVKERESRKKARDDLLGRSSNVENVRKRLEEEEARDAQMASLDKDQEDFIYLMKSLQTVAELKPKSNQTTSMENHVTDFVLGNLSVDVMERITKQNLVHRIPGISQPYLVMEDGMFLTRYVPLRRLYRGGRAVVRSILKVPERPSWDTSTFSSSGRSPPDAAGGEGARRGGKKAPRRGKSGEDVSATGSNTEDGDSSSPDGASSVSSATKSEARNDFGSASSSTATMDHSASVSFYPPITRRIGRGGGVGQLLCRYSETMQHHVDYGGVGLSRVSDYGPLLMFGDVEQQMFERWRGELLGGKHDGDSRKGLGFGGRDLLKWMNVSAAGGQDFRKRMGQRYNTGNPNPNRPKMCTSRGSAFLAHAIDLWEIQVRDLGRGLSGEFYEVDKRTATLYTVAYGDPLLLHVVNFDPRARDDVILNRLGRMMADNHDGGVVEEEMQERRNKRRERLVTRKSGGGCEVNLMGLVERHCEQSRLYEQSIAEQKEDVVNSRIRKRFLWEMSRALKKDVEEDLEQDFGLKSGSLSGVKPVDVLYEPDESISELNWYPVDEILARIAETSMPFVLVDRSGGRGGGGDGRGGDGLSVTKSFVFSSRSGGGREEGVRRFPYEYGVIASVYEELLEGDYAKKYGVGASSFEI